SMNGLDGACGKEDVSPLPDLTAADKIVVMPLSRTACAAVWAALAVVACNRSQSQGPPQMPPTPVTLVTAAATPIEDATEYVATLKSLRSTTIQPQIDGQITQIFVKSGDRV